MGKEKSQYWILCYLLLEKCLPFLAIIVAVLLVFGKMSSIPEIKIISHSIMCILSSLAGFCFSVIFVAVIYRPKTTSLKKKATRKLLGGLLLLNFIGSIVSALISAFLSGIGIIWGIIIGVLVFSIMASLLLVSRRKTRKLIQQINK